MGKHVNPDNSAFMSSYEDRIYVDKSGLIEYTNQVIGKASGFICNSRPRRFGKSMTANMLAAYYSKGADSKEIFSSLEIGSSPDFEKHLNKYDVIRLDIQACLLYVEKRDDVIRFITESVVKELKEIYPDEVTGGETSLALLLSNMNLKKGHRFVVIIDEWDVLIRDDTDNIKLQKDYISFLRSIFKGVQSSRYMALAYMTGILPIKREKTQSGLNNFDEFTIIDAGPFARYAGFTEEEVRSLCGKYNRKFEDVKRWYDGYRLDEYHIYNPRAVVNLMMLGKYRSYWSDTANSEIIVPLINMNYAGLKEAVIEMLSGGEVPVIVQTFKNDTVSISSRDNVLTYLIHLGYLAYNEKARTAFIPNEEIRQEMGYLVADNPWKEMTAFINDSKKILEATKRMDGEAVAETIEKIHQSYVSSLEYNDENSLSSVVTVAYLSSMERYFKPVRELPSGKGFCDVVYIPKPEGRADNPALVIELKWDKSAGGAIDQIKAKNYPDSIKDYTDNILLVGISYDRKTKKHECRIEKL